MAAITVTEDINHFIYVTVFVPFRESARYVGHKAAGAARKYAGGKVHRITSGGTSHGNGDWDFTYTYTRATK
jgi:hypothetical protein